MEGKEVRFGIAASSLFAVIHNHQQRHAER